MDSHIYMRTASNWEAIFRVVAGTLSLAQNYKLDSESVWRILLQNLIDAHLLASVVDEGLLLESLSSFVRWLQSKDRVDIGECFW